MSMTDFPNTNNNVVNLSDTRIKHLISKLRETEFPDLQAERMDELMPLIEAFGICIDERILKHAKNLKEVEDYYIGIIKELSQLLLFATRCLAQNQFKEIYQPMLDERMRSDEEEVYQAELFDTRPYTLQGPENLRDDVANKNSKLGYLGVTKKGNKYNSTIWHEPLREKGKQHAQAFLGSYSNPIQAAQIRDEAAKYLHGEKAKLNFPQQDF